MKDDVNNLQCICFGSNPIHTENIRAMLTVLFLKYLGKMKSMRELLWIKVQ